MIRLPNSADAPCDFAFLWDGSGECWLAYEIARDFLSVPKSFAIVALLPVPGGIYATNHLQTEADFEADIAEGLSLLSENPWHLTFRRGDSLLEIVATELSNKGILYHQLHARAALAEFFHQENLGL